jgi:hypothetical protein
MNGILKWILKTSAIAVCWVFILSIEVSGRSLFSHANEILVQNKITRTIEAEVSAFLNKAYIAVRQSVNDEKNERIQGMF